MAETMAPVTPDPLSSGGSMPLDMTGAESTVACYLAQFGVRAAWVSRVGDDPLGALLRDRVGGSRATTTTPR